MSGRTSTIRRIATYPMLFCLVALANLFSWANAEQWARFRGPNGAGSARSNVPSGWDDSHIRWQAALPGVGHSSPVVWQRKLFLTSGDEESGQRFVTCWDIGEGRQIWERRFAAAPHRKHKLNSFASPTPAVDAERVYLAWGTPEQTLVTALDHQGRDLWQVDLGKFTAGHGFGVSPILVDDLVILALEHYGASQWIALGKTNGAKRWAQPIESGSHYATPCVRQLEDRSEIIFTNWELGICGVDSATGQINWKADVFDKGHVESSISSPVLAGDLVIGVCGYLGHKYEVAAVRPAADSSSAELVWKLERGAPLCVTPVVKDDLLFLWADTGIVTCVDVATGETHWQRRLGGNYYSSPICLGDRLLNISVDGEVTVLAAAKEYEVLGKNTLAEGSHATPAVADGLLLLRTFSRIYAIGP